MKQKKLRKIPATMVTQHPDHAARPFWHDKPLVETYHETRECFISFADLNATEYKWDWEGKLVDESVIERLLAEHQEYFMKNIIGKDIFLTFRLPNPKVQTEYRLGRAFMGIISAASLAKFIGYPHNPLFEVILPMTESAAEMISIQEAFAEISSLKHPILKHEFSTINHIEIIPLFEKVGTISNADAILDTYLKRHQKIFGHTPDYMRPYVARSDPALNSGIVPTVLGIKIALSKFYEFEKSHNIRLFPVIGAGSLPFRGGLNPDRVDEFISEYQGIRTTTIQSAFRYDYSKESAKAAIATLENTLSKTKPMIITKKDEKTLRIIIKTFEAFYQEIIEEIAPLINRMSQYVPKRRERVQHVGLFGYARGEGKVKLPRAITFTAALYSLGIPPELIGTGRGIQKIKKLGYLPLLEKTYKNLKNDLREAGKYVNKKNLKTLSATSNSWQKVYDDISLIEEYLGTSFDTKGDPEKEHEKVTAKIFANITTGESLPLLIEEGAILRKSMG